MIEAAGKSRTERSGLCGESEWNLLQEEARLVEAWMFQEVLLDGMLR